MKCLQVLPAVLLFLERVKILAVHIQGVPLTLFSPLAILQRRNEEASATIKRFHANDTEEIRQFIGHEFSEM